MSPFPYPKAPVLQDLSFLKPSSGFKQSIYLVILSIFLFLLFYLFLVAVSVAILAGGIYAGIFLIASKPNLITLAVGAGLMAFGVMIFLFMIKFIFSRTKDENPLRLEIREADYPALFSFIRKLSEETGTKFPNRIYLSPDVNACVFYNSSFWSMFFPVRKNLEIGLGLVNSLNISEFKAVLAHEFGHFSQKSMTVGSYIYTVNRAIYNLVFEYDYWDELLSRWASGGGLFGLFAGITFWLVERIRALLKIAYNFINLSYMKLSREMEYHADLVAASVAGNSHLISALRKIEFTSLAYEHTTESLNTLSEKGGRTENLYLNHSFVVSHMARKNKLQTINGLLCITDDDLARNMLRSRINIKDQWASHPSRMEREQNLNTIQADAELMSQSCWELFPNARHLQAEATDQLYKSGFPDQELSLFPEDDFERFIYSEEAKYDISAIYNDFYYDRFLTEINTGSLAEQTIAGNLKRAFTAIYSDENKEKIKRYLSDRNDLETLRLIKAGNIQTRYFEFDHRKYRKKDSGALIKKLNSEVESQEQWLAALDEQAFLVNLSLARENGSGQEYLLLYETFASKQKALQEFSAVQTRAQNNQVSLYSKPRWTEDELKVLLQELSGLEKEFKTFLGTQDLEKIREEIQQDEAKETFRNYAEANNFIIKTTDFNEEAVFLLFNLVYTTAASLSTQYSTSLKELTDFQLKNYQPEETKHKPA